MKLRPRLVLGVIGTAVPLSLGLVIAQTFVERAQIEARIRDVTIARTEAFGRETCEADPASFPAPPRHSPFDDVEPLERFLFGDDRPFARPTRFDARWGPEHGMMFALDERLVPANPHAPAIDPALVRAMRGGGDVAERIHGRPPLEQAIVRMPWRTGPCAFVLVVRPALPRPRRIARLWPSLLVSFVVALAVLFVAGPVVRRVRALTEAVRRGEAAAVSGSGDDELAELTRAFREREATIATQINALADRERALREYIANTTHDVLVPLTVLQGSLVDLDRARAQGTVPDAASVRIALEESHYLGSLIHNLNAQARIDAALPPVRERVGLGALVERVVGRHRPIADRANIALDFAVPENEIHVLGDITLIEQAVSNLVHNAIRHNHEGGHVAIVLESEGARFRLTVLDDGPGVPSDELARLGERGFRTNEARTRRPDGSGLGLHIVRQVAEVHGFAVTFAANEPTGLRVAVEGPIEESAKG